MSFVVPNFINRLGIKWYFITRSLGVMLVLYGLLVDHTVDRSTILLGGFGLLGLEKVARSDSHKGE